MIAYIKHNLPSRCKAGLPSSAITAVEVSTLQAAAAIAILGRPAYGARFGGCVVHDGKVVFEF